MRPALCWLGFALGLSIGSPAWAAVPSPGVTQPSLTIEPGRTLKQDLGAPK